MKIKYNLILLSLALVGCQSNPIGKKNTKIENNVKIDSSLTIKKIPTKINKLEKKKIRLKDSTSKIVERIEIEKIKTVNYFSEKDLLGKIDPKTNYDFSKIETKYTSKSNIYMRTKAYDAFKKMSAAAKKEGLILKIISATRPFNYQKGIWNRKWNGKYAKVKTENRAQEILKWSSMPGTSRHHWGTDIDLNSLNNSYFQKGIGLKTYQWLQENAATYGFCQVYTEKGSKRPNGYNAEKWHWSYIPIASKMLEQYNMQIKYEDIKGFNGDHYAEEVKAIENYVNGVACH